ncbi:MAG: 30S ribosomal protein S6 [Planctomycetaceae bacterium]|jgi:small subunit ribosomal protein S6|nr:30S ribosomal protein S6 [Planctomycetaceae bacterium]
MSLNVYEGLFIFDSDLYAKGPDDVSGQVTRIIEQFGGEVLLSRLWDERKLAYPIKGHRRGTYWLAYLKIDSLKVKELTRQFQLSDSVIRFLFLHVDPRLVETLVEHARAGHLHAGEQQVAEETQTPTETVSLSENENIEETIDVPDEVKV